AMGHAVNRERSTLPQVDVVEIQLEDLVLRQAALEGDRHEPLGDLALQARKAAPLARLVESPHRAEERVAHQLLGDGAAAAQIFPAAEQIAEHRARRPAAV